MVKGSSLYYPEKYKILTKNKVNDCDFVKGLLEVLPVLKVFGTQVVNKPVAQVVGFAGHVLIACGRQDALGQPSKAVNVKPLHFIHGHVFSPQVDAQGVFLRLVPQRNADGLGFGRCCIGFVGGVPQDFIRYIITVEFYTEIDGGFSHGRLT